MDASAAHATDPQASASSLPRELREALAHALASGEALCVARPEPSRAKVASSLYGLVALVAVAGWGVLLSRGFGEPASPRAAASLLALEIAFASPALVMLVAFVRTVRAAAGDLPVPPGTYVLARGVLVAKPGGELVVVPVTPAPPSLAFEEEGAALVVRRPDGSEAMRVPRLPDVSPGAIARVAARTNGVGAMAFERLVGHARHGGASRREPHPLRGLVLGALGGGVLATAAFFARNAVSDARAFARAVTESEATADPAPLVLYATAGGRRAQEVEQELLPRRELARIVSAGTPDDLEAFLARHEGRSVGEEARRMRAAVVHRDFTTRDTVLALRDFLRRFPDAEDAPAARTRMHAIYMDARRAVHARGAAPGRDPDAAPVLEALLSWLEAHDSAPVPVRFRRSVAPSLARADGLLASGLLDEDPAGPPRGGNAPVAPRFEASGAEQRERAVVQALDDALAKELSPGILQLVLGPSLPAVDDAGPAPDRVPSRSRPAPGDAVTSPVLHIDYEVAWSGRTYVGRERGRRYVGVALQFFVVLAVPPGVATPGRGATLDLETRVEPEAAFTTTETDDDRVYEGMAARAFAQMALRFRERAFGLAADEARRD